jgi:hypothetical protein
MNLGGIMMVKVGDFNVRYVAIGDRYGRNNGTVNKLMPLVEFYDRRLSRNGDAGQFICRFDAEFIFIPQALHGFVLDERVPSWRLNHYEVVSLRHYLMQVGGHYAYAM